MADPNIAYTQQGSMQPTWLIFREDNMSQDFLPAAELNAVLLLELALSASKANRSSPSNPFSRRLTQPEP